MLELSGELALGDLNPCSFSVNPKRHSEESDSFPYVTGRQNKTQRQLDMIEGGNSTEIASLMQIRFLVVSL